MIKLVSSLLTLLFISGALAQLPADFNLKFETVQDEQPLLWQNFGGEGYILQVDSVVKKEGKYSALIASKGAQQDFAAWSFKLPNNYKGKKITLSGYIKTEEVQNGFVGLWMRIDPRIDFDNMQERNLNGTTDWTYYEITLTMNPEETEQIIIGGLMSGTGKAWFDDFKVTIDGKDILALKPLKKKVLPTNLDHEFDEGSGIVEIAPSEQQMENLTILGYVWGFLKYYHPAVARGEYNWDYELFRILPKVLEANSGEQRNQLLLTWINSLGSLTKGKQPKIKSSTVKISPDFGWIEHANFSDEIKAKLTEIRHAKRTNDHYYIDLYPEVENPNFKHEESYSKFAYPDAGYRILSLFRYWNIIHYYFPYKNLIEEDWKAVLPEFIPKFIEANDETEYTLTCLEMIARVHDSHANIWRGNTALDNYWGNDFPPVEVTFIEEKALVTNYFDKTLGENSGLQIGDIIESVNGKDVSDIVRDQLYITPGSNYATQLRNIAYRLLYTNDSIIQVTFRRNQQLESATFPSYTLEELNYFAYFEDTDTCFRMINEDIAYINNGTLQISYLPEIWEKVQHTKGLIIDIRNYPSDFPIHELSALLLPKKTAFVTFTNGNIQHPGYFTFNEILSVGKKKNKDYYKGKIVILVNEFSQSSAEFHAMAYRVHPNATVIGSTTAGADGNVSLFNLPGGIATMITGIGVYYPDGTETQRVGIVPDIECKPTIQGIREGKDEVLEKAVELIEQP